MVDRQDYFQKYREAYKQKKRRVTITMDLEDYAKFARDAEKLGASIPETIKAKALESEAKMVPQVNKELAGELGFLLRNMANNINQIAHNMNLNRHLYGPETNTHAHKVLQQLQDKLMHLEEELHTVLLLHKR